MPRLVKTTLTLFLLFGIVHAPLAAADSRDSSPPEALLILKERVLQMSEFLDTMLPGTLGAKNLTLHHSPKFTDLRDREFFRLPVEVRYGATDRLELRAGVSPFAPNPFNDGRDHRWGPGEAKFGAKYDLHRRLWFYDQATVGLETRIPLGHPPIELNDHYTHVRPWLATSRQLRRWPSTTFYTNFSYDRSVKLTPRDNPPPEVVRRHIAEIAPGLLYKPGEFGYFGEYRFRHFREPTGWHLGHEVQAGTIWDVPLRRSARWGLPGKWQISVGYRVTTEEGHDLSHGIKARVNWRTTLREVLDHVTNGRNRGDK